jgi:hypothetical protein
VFKFDKHVIIFGSFFAECEVLCVVFASDAYPDRSGAEVERWNRDFTPAESVDTTHTTIELKKLPDEHGDCIAFQACRIYNFRCTVVEYSVS